MYLHAKFHIPNSNGSVIIIAIKSGAKVKDSHGRHVVILHFTIKEYLGKSLYGWLTIISGLTYT
jgi:hypothetical protein